MFAQRNTCNDNAFRINIYEMDASLSSLADDLEDVNLEKTVVKAIKSEEEIESLTVDEKLTGIERAVYLLSSGQDVQRISVIEHLPDLLCENYSDCLRRVVPKVKEVLHLAQTDLQLVASAAFLQLLQNDLITINCFSQTFLPTIIMCIEFKDADVSSAWMDTLLQVIDALPKEVIHKQLLPLAIDKSKFSQSVSARLMCCRLLGRISLKFEPFMLKKDIVPIVQALCQDIDLEVRACMCNELEQVARGLGLEGTKSAILPELIELAKDEEVSVRIASFESISNTISLLEEGRVYVFDVQGVFLFCKFCQQAIDAKDDTLPCVSRHLGNLCHSLQGMLTDDQKRWLLDYYKGLCEVGLCEVQRSTSEDALLTKVIILSESQSDSELNRLTECRINAAYNFPAMVLFVGPKSFSKELLLSHNQLCRDPDVGVRRTAACSLHEVIQTLGVNSVCLIPTLTCLLRDSSTLVMKGLLMNLSDIITNLSKSASASKTKDSMCPKLVEIAQAMAACTSTVFAGNDWRLQEDLMKCYMSLSCCLSSEYIYNHVLPGILNRALTARARPVQLAACYSLICLVRNLSKLEWRDEYWQKIIIEFCRGKSCRHRGLFIDICLFTLELCSKNFFKNHLFDASLELCFDSVPNIRLRFSRLLPHLKTVLKLPTDRGRFQQMEGALRKLMIDEIDRDVMKAVSKTIDDLDQIHIPVETLSKRSSIFEIDTEDVRKEEEENLLIVLEEKERLEDIQNATTSGSGTVSSVRVKKISDGKRFSLKEGGSKTSLSVARPSVKLTNSTSGISREKPHSASDAMRSLSLKNKYPTNQDAKSLTTLKKTTPTMHRRASVPCTPAPPEPETDQAKVTPSRKTVPQSLIKRKSSK